MEITDGDKVTVITAENIIVATGSEPALVPEFNIDHERIITSDDALNLMEIPGEMIVVGAGALGLEFGYLFLTFGSKVTIVEMMPHVVPTMKDDELAGVISGYLEKKAWNLNAAREFQKISVTEGERVLANWKTGKLEADMALVAIGRNLNTKGIGLEEVGVNWTKGTGCGGRPVENNCTNFCGRRYHQGAQLSHKAQSRTGLSGRLRNDVRMSYDVIPSAIFIHPEIAMVGITADDAKEEGIETSGQNAVFQ